MASGTAPLIERLVGLKGSAQASEPQGLLAFFGDWWILGPRLLHPSFAAGWSASRTLNSSLLLTSLEYGDKPVSVPETRPIIKVQLRKLG
jgi:hypothetical protein